MFREMRRKKQELSLEESIAVLMRGTSGVLAVQGDNGYPYAVPISYAYYDTHIYFHCAKAGHKLDAVKRGEIEDWELEGSRRTLIGACLSTLDDQGRQEEFWLGQTAAALEEDPRQFAARLESVTREQVAAAAQKLELDTVYFLKGKEV